MQEHASRFLVYSMYIFRSMDVYIFAERAAREPPSRLMSIYEFPVFYLPVSADSC